MSHPSALALELFAVGEKSSTVESHLEGCAECSAHVERLRDALAAGPSKPLPALSALSAPRDHERARTTVRAIDDGARRRWLAAATVAIPLAIAAAILLILRGPGASDGAAGTTASRAPGSAAPGSSMIVAARDPAPPKSDPEITFKGGIQVAVIRDRGGEQARFTTTVSVKPGDRLRVEVALDREQAILAAVLGDDSSWLELMAEERLREPGTHFSERSARVDAQPLQGTILVGTPEAVRRARETKRFDDVASIRVEWEAP